MINISNYFILKIILKEVFQFMNFLCVLARFIFGHIMACLLWTSSADVEHIVCPSF